jgi:hypothetical protein
MPFKITGKILDDQGTPLYQVAQITEMPLVPGLLVGANVWTDENTGAFTFYALNPDNLMKVESIGYKPRFFKAKEFPAIVKLEPALVIEGNTKKKKDNTLAWVLAGVATLVAVGFATSKKNAPAAKSLPKKAKAQPKVKTVTV